MRTNKDPLTFDTCRSGEFQKADDYSTENRVPCVSSPKLATELVHRGNLSGTHLRIFFAKCLHFRVLEKNTAELLGVRPVQITTEFRGCELLCDYRVVSKAVSLEATTKGTVRELIELHIQVIGSHHCTAHRWI